MEALVLDYDLEAEIKKHQESRVKNRSKGRHLSSIIHRIASQKDPERFSGGVIQPLDVHIGFIWEDVWDLVMSRQLGGGGRQMELVEDGIFMTPDQLDFKKWRVREFKATKISAKNPIRGKEFWHWHVQVACYCRAMGTLEAELIALHINGSYELGGGRFGKTVARPWLLRFTPMELKQYWRMILRERDRMDEEEEAA